MRGRAIAQPLTYLATSLEILTRKGSLPFLCLSYSRPGLFSPVPALVIGRQPSSPMVGSTAWFRLKEVVDPIIPRTRIPTASRCDGLRSFENETCRSVCIALLRMSLG